MQLLNLSWPPADEGRKGGKVTKEGKGTCRLHKKSPRRQIKQSRSIPILGSSARLPQNRFLGVILCQLQFADTPLLVHSLVTLLSSRYCSCSCHSFSCLTNTAASQLQLSLLQLSYQYSCFSSSSAKYSECKQQDVWKMYLSLFWAVSSLFGFLYPKI
jgi:hypothetical protein